MVTRKIREPKADSPSFFKVIRYPSATHLPLPNAFVRKYMDKIPKYPTLVTATGDHSWKMEFVKIGEDYCFAHGWEALVKDVGLCSKDIVVFWLIDSSTFQVTFLGFNGCEKLAPLNTTNDDDVVKDDGEDDDDDDDDDGQCHDDFVDEKNLCFKKVVVSGKYFRYYMSLPIKFVKAAGIEHKQNIKLKDHKGHEWIMGIAVQGHTSLKYGFSAGWSMFRKHHNFSEGDELTFAYDKQEDKINLTQVVRSRRPMMQSTSMEEVNRNKGIQSCYGYGNVKIEDEWSPTEKLYDRGGVKVNTEYDPRLKTCVNVKIEYDWVPERVVVEKRKRELVPPEEPSWGGGVGENTEPRMDGLFGRKTIYF